MSPPAQIVFTRDEIRLLLILVVLATDPEKVESLQRHDLKAVYEKARVVEERAVLEGAINVMVSL
jgi:hypothetical protein